jgi:DNA processing protein
LSLSSSDYPEYLKEIFDPPTVLYYFGDVKPDDVCMGIVGSRKSSEYGKNTAKSFASKLSQNGFAVVSGMARGIDTKAHEGALESEGKTYAIIGSGLDIVYPPENKKLMQKIIDNGAVISEFPPGTKPNPYNFPIRNRIISGMSLGVIVVEAGLRSGSLITANLALEQGRDVFAVPGNINRIINKGSNKLIKEGAKLVENIDDILEEYKTFINLDKSNNIKKNNKNKQCFNR